MPFRLGRIIALLPALLAIAGCAKPLIKGTSPLAPARMSPDSCVLDVFFVRVPFGDPRANDELWRELDEQHFAADLRARLMRNGFRVGLLDGQIPVVLSNLMELGDKPPPTDEIKGTNITDLGSKPRVIRQHMQIHAGRPSEILASGIYEQLPVLFSESHSLGGDTYYQAQAIFNLKAFPLADGRVRVDLTPEVHHDQPRQRRVEDQGVLRFDFSKPKRVFDDIAISAKLSPGGMLVMTSLPNLSGSLGHCFFTETENEGRLEQKLLIIRLSQTQYDGLFVAPEESPPER
ncbi:MAG: hypothetical protein ABSA16_01855 [Thermoguttaceae bacterium]|jgi:hypothetical protein